jgi:hypothetical protein
MRYDNEMNSHDSPDPIRCITLSIALIYYFRLPTKEDNRQRNDLHTPTREDLGELLSETIPDFVKTIQYELEMFVNTDNFVIPHGVAINQAVCLSDFFSLIYFFCYLKFKVREHVFAIVVSIATRTPLCIIGAPGKCHFLCFAMVLRNYFIFIGQSKTLSFQIALQNLQGTQISTKPFCKRLPAIDPFFCLGSKYSRSEDIAYVFDRAIQREQQYQQNRMETRCVSSFDLRNRFRDST